VPLDDRVLDKLSPESYVFRTYEDAAAGGDIGLYVAYYRDPREGAQIPLAAALLSRRRWRILDSRPLQVRDPAGQPTRMQRLVVEKHGRRDVVVYWYDTRTGRLTNDFELKLNLMRTALMHRPQDAAFVRWSSPPGGR
jgi:EpsI family protein